MMQAAIIEALRRRPMSVAELSSELRAPRASILSDLFALTSKPSGSDIQWLIPDGSRVTCVAGRYTLCEGV
jgi:hypothetical protein